MVEYSNHREFLWTLFCFRRVTREDLARPGQARLSGVWAWPGTRRPGQDPHQPIKAVLADTSIRQQDKDVRWLFRLLKLLSKLLSGGECPRTGGLQMLLHHIRKVTWSVHWLPTSLSAVFGNAVETVIRDKLTNLYGGKAFNKSA